MSLTIKKQLEKEPNLWINKALTLVGVLVLVAWASQTIMYSGVKENGLQIVQNIFTSILQPDLEMLFDFKEGVPFLLLETVCIAFLGTLIGAVLALPLAFLASSNIMPKWVNFIILTVISGIRTFPAFVFGLMFIRVTGPGAFAGVLTVSVVSIGMLSKLFIEAIEDLDIRILESLDAAGCNTFEKIRYGIIPQLFTNLASIVIYRFEINIKDASTLGLVGAGGIGAPLIFAMNAFNWTEVGSILLGLIILVLVVETGSTKLRTKLARG
ncbi:MAG TPA: phosphonate ABC transporter, permease protein PhnE [Firmicutes bacterium]|nr:phosphonate ABC transporter, permease protein PhnE [Bacillota bacterium]